MKLTSTVTTDIDSRKANIKNAARELSGILAARFPGVTAKVSTSVSRKDDIVSPVSGKRYAMDSVTVRVEQSEYEGLEGVRKFDALYAALREFAATRGGETFTGHNKVTLSCFEITGKAN